MLGLRSDGHSCIIFPRYITWTAPSIYRQFHPLTLLSPSRFNTRHLPFKAEERVVGQELENLQLHLLESMYEFCWSGFLVVQRARNLVHAQPCRNCTIMLTSMTLGERCHSFRRATQRVTGYAFMFSGCSVCLCGSSRSCGLSSTFVNILYTKKW